MGRVKGLSQAGRWPQLRNPSDTVGSITGVLFVSPVTLGDTCHRHSGEEAEGGMREGAFGRKMTPNAIFVSRSCLQS